MAKRQVKETRTAPSSIVELAFHNEWEGIFVRCEMYVDLDVMFVIQELLAEDFGEAMKLFTAHALIDWNYPDSEGNIKPITGRNGIMPVPLAFAKLLIPEWIKAVANLPDPLYEPSTNGRPLEREPSEVMEPLSVSPGS